MTHPTSAAPEALKLKPCPFCGESLHQDWEVGGWNVIQCGYCGACGPYDGTNKWNTRPTPPLSGSAAEVSSLRQKLSHAYQALGRIFNERDREFKPVSPWKPSTPDSLDLVKISREQYDHYQTLKMVIDEIRSEL